MRYTSILSSFITNKNLIIQKENQDEYTLLEVLIKKYGKAIRLINNDESISFTSYWYDVVTKDVSIRNLTLILEIAEVILFEEHFGDIHESKNEDKSVINTKNNVHDDFVTNFIVNGYVVIPHDGILHTESVKKSYYLVDTINTELLTDDYTKVNFAFWESNLEVLDEASVKTNTIIEDELNSTSSPAMPKPELEEQHMYPAPSESQVESAAKTSVNLPKHSSHRKKQEFDSSKTSHLVFTKPDTKTKPEPEPEQKAKSASVQQNTVFKPNSYTTYFYNEFIKLFDDINELDITKSSLTQLLELLSDIKQSLIDDSSFTLVQNKLHLFAIILNVALRTEGSLRSFDESIKLIKSNREIHDRLERINIMFITM